MLGNSDSCPSRHVWMAPGVQGFFRVLDKAAPAVMCPACMRGTTPLAVMGTADRDLIMATGSHCPKTGDRSASICRLTDNAIMRVHPRKPSASAGPGRSGRRRHGAEVLLAHHQRPCDARHLVGQCDRHQLARLAGQQPDQPRVLSRLLAINEGWYKLFLLILNYISQCDTESADRLHLALPEEM